MNLKRQVTGWGKVLETHKTDRGLECRTYKEHLQINVIDNLIESWMRVELHTKSIVMANKYVKMN